MRRMPRPASRWLAAGLATALLLVPGCRSDGGADLPAATDLLPAAADAMAQLETAKLVVETDTDLAELPVRRADGVVTRAGDAAGTAQLNQLSMLIEMTFVVVEDTFYYQLIGGWQELPLSEAADLYDPSAILDPDRGVANLLRTADKAKVDTRETSSGVDTYRVSAELAPDALSTLLPGVNGPAAGVLWIGVDQPLLHQIEISVPAGNESGTATVRLSDFDAPVDISAP